MAKGDTATPHHDRHALARSPGGRASSKAGAEQRERLLSAITRIAATKPYSQITVAELVADAGVSRQTFYEHFDDRDACFAAAYQRAGRILFDRMRKIIQESDWSAALELALDDLLTGVAREPEAAWLFFVEGLAGPSSMRADRNASYRSFEHLTHEFLDRAPADGKTLDIPPIALLGAIRAIISNHLRASAVDRLPEVAGDLAGWIRSYAISANTPRWSASERATLATPAFVKLPDTLLPRPKRLPRKHGLPSSVVTRNRRVRIIHATAEMAHTLGYQRMRLSDIVAEAGIAKNVFYEHFQTIEEAFIAAQQYALQETLTACAYYYFTGTDWPQRVWRCMAMLTTLMSKEPALAYTRFVEPYAVGRRALDRQQDMIATYTVFVQEGYLQAPASSPRPQLFTEAICGSLFELLRRETSERRTGKLACHLPQLTYIAAAPFIGPERAAARVDELAATHRAHSRQTA